MELRKNEGKDLRKKGFLFFNIGLVVSLGLVISAFEWKSYEREPIIPDITLEPWEDPVLPPIPNTVHTIPKPPKPKLEIKPKESNKFTVVPDEELKEVAKTLVDLEPEKEVIISDEDFRPTITKEETDKPVYEYELEVKAEPEGGMDTFYRYLRKNLKYPKQALRLGVSGQVFLEFIIDKSGNITHVKVVKGIGSGCDEEALRVINSAPPWKPGKIRGRPVSVKMVMPIIFKD